LWQSPNGKADASREKPKLSSHLHAMAHWTRRRQQSLLSTCDRVGEARSRSLSENNWQMDNPATLARFESGRDSMLAEEARRRSTSSCHGHRSSKRAPRKQASRQGHPEGSPSKKIELVAGGSQGHGQGYRKRLEELQKKLA
jgi:hypothetical protein